MSVNLPTGYKDEFPGRGPWCEPASTPPRYAVVETLFADGTTGHATWTGRVWWDQCEVAPLGWRPLPGPAITCAPAGNGA